MYNPYNVRPIGSEKFLEHLKDAQTKGYYETKNIYEEENIKTNLHGSIPWGEKDNTNDGYTSLMMAIIADAIQEYLCYYYHRNRIEEKEGRDTLYWVYNSRCIELENGYFRRNPFLEEIFDKLLTNVCWEGNEAIDDCFNRMQKLLRWSKTEKK